mgnify:CR=1 FL=1
MQTLTNAHKTAINTITLLAAAEYIQCYAHEDNEVDAAELQVYAADVMYNIAALQQFNQTGDVLALHDAIMQQDTIVREAFVTVLNYIAEVQQQLYDGA